MKTTKKDFELFKQHHAKWCDKLGVKNWSIHFRHEHTEDSYAQTWTNHVDSVCTVVLSDYWDDMRDKNEVEIDRLALHEVLHLVMAHLTDEARSRYTSEEAIRREEHTIIRQLENIIV